jgi:hypothetical protein
VANAGDPAKNEAEGNECKAYGAGNIMRMPTRVHITWDNDNALRLETVAGMQTRLFQFGESKPPAGCDDEPLVAIRCRFRRGEIFGYDRFISVRNTVLLEISRA